VTAAEAAALLTPEQQSRLDEFVESAPALTEAQRTLLARIRQAIPAARTQWRYSVVVDGMAVVVPRSDLARLGRIPGATVWPSITYRALGEHAAAPSVSRRAEKRPSPGSLRN